MVWIILAAVLAGLAAAAAAAAIHGARCWRSETERLFAKLEDERNPVAGGRCDSRELQGLPLPVQRYLRTALQEGQAMISAAHMEHAGTFNVSAAAQQWKHFTSRQRTVIRRPGFVWDARIQLAPAVAVRVHDAYVGGAGVLRAKMFGLVTVMEQPNSPELAHGELLRFFSEAAWYPTVLLPGQGVLWEELDTMRSVATLKDGATTVKLVFSFDDRGLLRTVRSERRHREVNGVLTATPWEGRFWGYTSCHGMVIPMEGEAAWLGPEGPHPYWRGTVRRIEYEYAAG